MKIMLKGSREHEIDSRHINELVELYPNIDVMIELRKAIHWCRVNPGRRKTQRGLGKFLNSWMTRASETERDRRANNPSAGNHAASHKQFKRGDELYKTSDEDKRRGEEQLRRLEELQRRAQR